MPLFSFNLRVHVALFFVFSFYRVRNCIKEITEVILVLVLHVQILWCFNELGLKKNYYYFFFLKKELKEAPVK